MFSKTNFPFLILAVLLSRAALADKVETRHGYYSVPVPAGLSGLATFPVDYRITTDDEGVRTLSYFLPEDVVGGQRLHVTIEEKAQGESFFIPFTSDAHGTQASCKPNNDKLTCLVAYPRMALKAEDVTNFVARKYLNSPDKDIRQQIAQLFSADPRGIINY